MKCFPTWMLLFLFGAGANLRAADPPTSNIQHVANTPGLIAFWDFKHAQDGVWTSYYDAQSVDRAFRLHLKRIGDPKTYTLENWPYTDEDSKPAFDHDGPFGHAARFNKGYIYGAVERNDFDRTPLDLHGHQPFTLIAWAKFIGKRHMVAGIWDEGGWDKYAGRRQVALFGGLFGKKGVIAHVSATGASSFPQSNANGSQYARLRAIDGQDFKNNQWVAMATTYDPTKAKVTAYLNGTMTPLMMTDSVAQDVYRYPEKQAANPYDFALPIYAPRAFVLKYNGYHLEQDGISEHRLRVDLDRRTLLYECDPPEPKNPKTFRVLFDIQREDKSLLAKPIEFRAGHGQQAAIPTDLSVVTGDTLRTTLEVRQDDQWKPVGKAIDLPLREGAPFTFGRALGLGSEDLTHGSQISIDGVAVFNRVMDERELKALSFTGSGAN